MISAADLTGHWRRDWLQAPAPREGRAAPFRPDDRGAPSGRGNEGVPQGCGDAAPPRRDDTTAVHWLQAPGGYVDIRVPAGLDRLAGAAPADLSAPDLAALMEAEGFAGTIAVAGGVCGWARAIDWHGASEAVDAGRMTWDAGGALIETGVHADYAERWLREPSGAMGSRVLARGSWRLHLAWSDEALAMGVAEPGAPASAPLREALGRGERPAEAIERQFRGEFTYARWVGEHAVAVLSTHPMRPGERILTRAALRAAAPRLTRRDARGRAVEEEWQVL